MIVYPEASTLSSNCVTNARCSPDTITRTSFIGCSVSLSIIRSLGRDRRAFRRRRLAQCAITHDPLPTAGAKIAVQGALLPLHGEQVYPPVVIVALQQFVLPDQLVDARPR